MYVAQGNGQTNAEIAEKGHFGTGTRFKGAGTTAWTREIIRSFRPGNSGPLTDGRRSHPTREDQLATPDR